MAKVARSGTMTGSLHGPRAMILDTTRRVAVAGVVALVVGGVVLAAPLGPGDLAGMVPEASDMCGAVGMLYAKGRMQVLLGSALPSQRQGAGRSSLVEVRHFVTDRAWDEVINADYGMDRYPDEGFTTERVELIPGEPAAWVISTRVGSLHDPLLWVFASTPDGAKADHLLMQLGEEGSGPFETAFVRFREVPYAVEQAIGSAGEVVDVYAIGSVGKGPICSFTPPGYLPVVRAEGR